MQQPSGRFGISTLLVFQWLARRDSRTLSNWCAAALSIAVLLVGLPVRAEVVCAEVKIEIRQKLNVERQAFLATLKINNGLTATDLTEVGVNLKFADGTGIAVPATADPNDTQARFFVREDFLLGINGGVQGAGVVSAQTTGEAHWLIIPAPGSGGATASGENYFVGATLTYNEAGEPRTLEVTPELITVAPQPLLELDYFLPREVYGDDPFTPAVEPSEPFPLGVRVANTGYGPASQVSIESAQPRIVDNQQGLLVGFQIDGSYVQDHPAQASLLVDFGQIDPSRMKAARWVMSTTLSGRFVDFGAEFTHADSLGGAVTSLLQRVGTHTLLKDVRVDLPGRDGVRDFLALDGDVVRVYEDEGLDTEVADQSASGSAQTVSDGIDVVFSPLGTALFAQVPDPTQGAISIGQVTRSDGKIMPRENVWKSRVRDASGSGWMHYLNVFDVGGTGHYHLATATAQDVSSLAGKVFLDVDGDGFQSAVEPGLDSVVMTLHGSTAEGPIDGRFARSDAAGAFRFDDVAAGEYSLIDGLLDQTGEGTHTVGSAGGVLGADRVSAIVLAAGQQGEGYVFAKRPLSALADVDVAARIDLDHSSIALNETLVGTLTVSNAGPSASDVLVTWQVPPSLTQLNASSMIGTVDRDRATWKISQLAAGSSVSLRLDLRGDGEGSSSLRAVAAPYAHELQEVDNVALASIDVYDKPLVSQELDTMPRVLALVSCYAGSTLDVACTNTRAARLSMLLGELGVEHSVVTTTLAYREALRSGRYNVHWVSGGGSKLSTPLAEELRNALRRGEGVIVDGVHAGASSVIDDVAGISYVSESTGNALSFTTNETLPMDPLNLLPSGVLSIQATTASVAAQFDDGSAAILSQTHGEGRVLTFAFELVDSAALDSAHRSDWDTLIETALSWLMRAPGNVQVGKDFVPVATRLENPRPDPVTIDVAMMPEAGLLLATAQPAMEADGTTGLPHWRRTLAAGAVEWIEAGFRVPAGSGTTGVDTVVSWVRDDGLHTLLATRQTLQVSADDQRYAAVLSALAALTPDSSEQIELRDSAVASVSAAQSSQPATAVTQLVNAETSVSGLLQPEAASIALEIARLVEEAEAKWQALNPRCGEADLLPVAIDPSTFWSFSDNEGLAIQGGLPGNADWEWAIGTNVNSNAHNVHNEAFSWISGARYNWHVLFRLDGTALMEVSDASGSLFTYSFAADAPGIRSGNAVRMSVTLNNSVTDTPIRASIDRVAGAPANAVLDVGVDPVRQGSVVLYFPTLEAGADIEGSVQIDFTGTALPERKKLSIMVNPGETACRPELNP